MKTVDQLLQGTLSLLLQHDLSPSASLCLQHEPENNLFRHIYFCHKKTTLTFTNNLQKTWQNVHKIQ